MALPSYRWFLVLAVLGNGPQISCGSGICGSVQMRSDATP
jgi:hypothetical protein